MLNSLLSSLSEIIGSDEQDKNKLMKIETLVRFTQNVSDNKTNTIETFRPTPTPTKPISPSVPVKKEGVIFGVEDIN